MKIRTQIFKFLVVLTMVSSSLMATSCLNEYLDKAPDSGLDKEEVFSKYENFRSFLYAVYDGSEFRIKAHYPMTFHGSSQKFTMEALTDMCDMTRIQLTQPVKQGDGSQAKWVIGYNTNTKDKVAKVPYSWKAIRVCNLAIENIDMLQDATPQQKEDLLAQAYFVRAYCHFELFRLYGSLPYLDKALGSDDEWDLPRLSDYDYCKKCADDFQTAADHFKAAGLMRRDPASGAGNLAAPDQDKPNGVAALAMKGRVLLYAASPLSNPENDKTKWEEAAIANAAALKAALDEGYYLLESSQYTNNFWGVKYTNEQLWAYSTGQVTRYSAENIQAFIPSCFSANSYNSGQCPTQNFVDKFETREGYPLNTEEQRAVATAAGAYNEQDPYKNRDPRFDFVVIYNQKPIQGYGNAAIYLKEDGSTSGTLLDDSNGSVSATFYYEQKRTGPLSQKGQTDVMLTDPIIRLAEVYLNYAEAANEAYGPDGMAPGCDMTALQALNKIRERVNMPPVRQEYTGSTEALRPRIKNERAVELCFEGYHYYCDIRRWKDAPEIGRSRLYGMRATKTAVSSQYPTGFRYERFELPSNRQISWKNDGMYYIQFQDSDLLKMKNYVPNMAW